jgi:hypothetical protein
MNGVVEKKETPRGKIAIEIGMPYSKSQKKMKGMSSAKSQIENNVYENSHSSKR